MNLKKIVARTIVWSLIITSKAGARQEQIRQADTRKNPNE